MKGKKGKLRLVRRAAAALTAAVVIPGVLSGLGGVSLPKPLFGGGASDGLAQAMLEVEVGAFQEEDSSLWERMVTSELPLGGALEEDEAEPEAQAAILPASDSLQEEQEAAQQPEEAAGEAPQAEPLAEEDGGTAVPETITTNSNTVSAEGISVNNGTTGITVDPAALAASVLTQTIAPADQGPQILIMHTHGTEAYTMAGEDFYDESDTARTTDSNYNMIRIGEEMKAVFESMGFSVVHDTSLYDYPSYNGSYARSLAGIQQMLEQYPTISVVLDVHRDALIAADGTVYKAVTQVDGAQTAQVMLVVGTNDGGLDHPRWQENLNLAAKIQLSMTSIEPTLARPINLRSQRFNQHMTPGSLLVEVGTSGNTLQEALRGARYFAQAAGAVYQGLVAG